MIFHYKMRPWFPWTYTSDILESLLIPYTLNNNYWKKTDVTSFYRRPSISPAWKPCQMHYCFVFAPNSFVNFESEKERTRVWKFSGRGIWNVNNKFSRSREKFGMISQCWMFYCTLWAIVAFWWAESTTSLWLWLSFLIFISALDAAQQHQICKQHRYVECMSFMFLKLRFYLGMEYSRQSILLLRESHSYTDRVILNICNEYVRWVLWFILFMPKRS